MDNQKTKKWIIILLLMMFVLTAMVWGVAISLFATSQEVDSNPEGTTAEEMNVSGNDELDSEVIDDSTSIDEGLDSKVVDEEFEKKVALAEEAYNNQDLNDAIKNIEEALSIKNDEIAIELKNKYTEEQNKVKEENNTNIQVDRENLLKNINKDYDDMTDVSWYKPKGELQYDQEDGTEKFLFYAYIGEKNNEAWLRLATEFEAEDWIFTNRIIVKSDEYRFNIPFDPLKDRQGDVLYGGIIVEWIDILTDDDMLGNLKRIIDSKETKVRFDGDTYYNEYTINSTQKKQLKDIIDYYELVK